MENYLTYFQYTIIKRKERNSKFSAKKYSGVWNIMNSKRWLLSCQIFVLGVKVTDVKL